MLVLTLDDISSQGRVYMLVLVAPSKYNLFLSLVEYRTMSNVQMLHQNIYAQQIFDISRLHGHS